MGRPRLPMELLRIDLEVLYIVVIKGGEYIYICIDIVYKVHNRILIVRSEVGLI